MENERIENKEENLEKDLDKMDEAHQREENLEKDLEFYVQKMDEAHKREEKLTKAIKYLLREFCVATNKNPSGLVLRLMVEGGIEKDEIFEIITEG